MAKSTGGNKAQFTYDFGISIAQSTVNKLTRVTGATLTLASAFYALKSAAKEYVDTLRENTLRFGGVLSTMKAMEQAQDRLIKGQSYFSVDDQLKGMNQLMAAGIDVGKNFDWVNKAAHATGKSYAEFSGMIASAIQGNAQSLVDAGLMTQRATRMFDKYAANTVMRQQAILNFVKNHKGLMNAIKNDFETIQDQITRIKGIWSEFLKSIIGKPNDPGSFYGQIVSSMKLVAEALARNMEDIRRYGWVIGQVLGWVIKQIGHFVVWIGKQAKKALQSVWKMTDDYVEQTRSMLVWLEFWKVRIVEFFQEYGNEIKTVLKLLIGYVALKKAFVIGGAAIKSVQLFRKAFLGNVLLQKRYMQSMGPFVSKTKKLFQSLAVWMPRPFRKAWVWLGKFFADFSINMKIIGGKLVKFIKAPFSIIGRSITWVLRLVKNLPLLLKTMGPALRALSATLLSSNPIGWVIAVIALLVVLYTKSKTFRVFINNLFKAIFEFLKLVWNSLMYLITLIMVGCKKAWNWFKTYIWNPVSDFFKKASNWIGDMWSKFKDTAVGKWIDKWIVQPLKDVFDWIADVWNKLVQGMGKVINWLSGANDKVSQATEDLAKEHGVPVLPTFKGGTYDTNDDTNYLDMGRLMGGGNPTTPDEPGTPENPMLSNASDFGGGGGGNVTNMNFDGGAIQIIVNKGGNDINEHELARKVKTILNDMKREGDMRGGNV